MCGHNQLSALQRRQKEDTLREHPKRGLRLHVQQLVDAFGMSYAQATAGSSNRLGSVTLA
jgi:hypothetical protein